MVTGIGQGERKLKYGKPPTVRWANGTVESDYGTVPVNILYLPPRQLQSTAFPGGISVQQ